MKLLSIIDVSEVLGVSRATTTRMITEGQLPAIILRAGRRKKVWRVRSEALEKWVATKERETGRDIAGSRGAVSNANNGNHEGRKPHAAL